jgi:hypothetical protein
MQHRSLSVCLFVSADLFELEYERAGICRSLFYVADSVRTEEHMKIIL